VITKTASLLGSQGRISGVNKSIARCDNWTTRSLTLGTTKDGTIVKHSMVKMQRNKWLNRVLWSWNLASTGYQNQVTEKYVHTTSKRHRDHASSLVLSALPTQDSTLSRYRATRFQTHFFSSTYDRPPQQGRGVEYLFSACDSIIHDSMASPTII